MCKKTSEKKSENGLEMVWKHAECVTCMECVRHMTQHCNFVMEDAYYYITCMKETKTMHVKSSLVIHGINV